MLELLTDSHVDLASSSARHGAGLFETIRIQDGQPRCLEAHLERLASGAAFLGMEAPPSAEMVRTFLNDRGLCAGIDKGVLCLLAVDGKLIPLIVTWPLPRPERITIGLSERITRNSQSPLTRFKTFSYLENLVLAKEAEVRGMYDCIALNEAGRLTDGWRTNLFLVHDDRVLTSRVEDGALPGIARKCLLEAGLAEEACLGSEDFRSATAVFLTNALQGAVPVHQIEGRPVDPLHPLLERAAVLLR